VSASRIATRAFAALIATTVLSSCAAYTTGSAPPCGYAFVMQDPISTSTAEQTIQRGLDRAAADLGVTVDVIDGTGLAGVADNLRAAAAKGCYEAVGTAFFANGDTVTQIAAEFPEQAFYIAGGVAEGPNVTSFNAANEEGTYVAGAMAAALTESGTIGVILGDDSPALVRYSEGFTAGAARVDPAVQVITTSVGSFSDPAKTGSIAASQAGQGADVIYSAAGSNLQVYALGAEKGFRTIASDLTDWAAVKDTDPALAFIAAPTEDTLNYQIIKAYADRSVPGGEKRDLGLEDGIFVIPGITGPASADYTLPQHVIDAGKAAYEHMLSGGAIDGR
jgi:basic membrane protein A